LRWRRWRDAALAAKTIVWVEMAYSEFGVTRVKLHFGNGFVWRVHTTSGLHWYDSQASCPKGMWYGDYPALRVAHDAYEQVDMGVMPQICFAPEIRQLAAGQS
jgi:hypothetical protein